MSFNLDKARQQAKEQSKKAKSSVESLVKPKAKMGRPKTPNAKNKTINVRISEDLLKKVNKKIDKEPRSVTLSSIILKHLEEYVRKDSKDNE